MSEENQVEVSVGDRFYPDPDSDREVVITGFSIDQSFVHFTAFIEGIGKVTSGIPREEIKAWRKAS